MLLWSALLLPYFTLAFLAIPLTAPAGAAEDNWCRLVVPCFSRAMCTNSKDDGGVAGVFHQCAAQCAAQGKPGGDWGYCFPRQERIILQIPIGSTTAVVDLGQYIQVAYRFAVGAAAVISATMFMMGGFQYLNAGGDSGRVNRAKQRIKDALIGLALTVGAYIMLMTVNPDTLVLQAPRIPLVPPKRFLQCDYFKWDARCGLNFGLKVKSGTSPTADPRERYEVVSATDGNAVAVCLGSSCSLTGTSGVADGTHTCQLVGEGQAPNPIPSTGSIPPYDCRLCDGDGRTCRGWGPNAKCCGGFCTARDRWGARVTGTIGALAGLEGVCGNGDIGQSCAVDDECRSGNCVDVTGSFAGGICLTGSPGAGCDADEECKPGLVCVQKTGINVCVTPGYYSPCAADADCPAGTSCQDYRCQVRKSSRISCSGDSEGADDECGRTPNTGIYAEVTAGRQLHACFLEEYNYIADNVYRCIEGTPGAPCKVGGHQECDDYGGWGHCYDSGITDRSIIAPSGGVCVDGTAGAGCDNSDDCRGTKICYDTKGVGGHCSYDGFVGDPCSGHYFAHLVIDNPEGVPPAFSSLAQGTCQEGLLCHPNSHTCVRPASQPNL